MSCCRNKPRYSHIESRMEKDNSSRAVKKNGQVRLTEGKRIVQLENGALIALDGLD